MVNRNYGVWSAPRLALAVVLLAGLFLAALPAAQPAAAVQVPPGGTVRARLAVPEVLRSGYLAADRYLNIPANFEIEVWARVPGARFMAVAPNGDLLVSQPGAGKVVLLRPDGSNIPRQYDFATGLRNPHDIVFHTIGPTTYVYIAESHQINRYVYTAGDLAARGRQVVVANLPDANTPELRGAYGHQLKNIALDNDHKLYVSIASTCNACLSDTVSNPRRGAIYRYEADGSNPQLFAQGIRNAEGLAILPGTNELWVTINNRDNIRVPDPASPDYKKIVPSYVDNHPPEEFTRVREGGNYGWPFCNPNPDTPAGLDNMPYDRDVEFNENGQVDCDRMDRINKGIQAHSAPLGLTFLHDSLFPPPYRNGAVMALHGSWNRTLRTGYKLAFFPWTPSGPGQQVDLVSGWLDDASQQVWGRPVDMVVDGRGQLYISDDYAGAVYRLSYRPSSGQFNFAETAFRQIWRATDELVPGGAGRGYLWGPGPFSEGLLEEYADSPGGRRLVQYFDKSRMEINRPDGDRSRPFYVTNGLLVRELASGRLQIGDNRFVELEPSYLGVAGDPDDNSGPTYAALNGLTGPAGNQTGAPVTRLVDRNGLTREAASQFGQYNVRLAAYAPETGHNIAGPFWAFLNSTGPLLNGSGAVFTGRIFEPLYYATGLPITEPHWARVKVAGQERDVLVQAFERRVLTYTPSNPAAFQVEMGNVGRHYFQWRYLRPAGS